MNGIDQWVRLSAIHVQWSTADAAFVAVSEQFPGLTYQHESSLTALDGLVDLIHASLAVDRRRS
ncbi:hypothetical protein [Nocardia wallacei]|uniref:hypothetical protein n=1 Tax=Nocardia wallacei TaxID=480035 RepID=UPI0024557A5B|nr:hypothetical protein [Nocardia wallacei]